MSRPIGRPQGTRPLRPLVLALRAATASAEEAPPVVPNPEPEATAPPWWQRGELRASGLLQPQAEWSGLSEDELNPDGGALNQDRFLIRRGRLRVDKTFDVARASLEIDANTVRGPFLSLRRAEVAFFLPSEEGTPTALEVVAGLTEVPFGAELRQGVGARVFMERTTASLAFFRGEPDVGLLARGALGPFRYAVAVQNGVPLDDRPNAITVVQQHQKTGVGRIGVELGDEDWAIVGGASALAGTGFHAGTPSRKSALLWRDLNQDGFVTANELVAIPSQAALPSSTFGRWGVNADLAVGLHTKLGWTRIYGEVTMASNLDRSLFVADPVAAGYDVRETAWNAALLQELGPHGLLGVRVDQYDPNSDLFDERRGAFIPLDATITTISPVVGLQIQDFGRVVFQYDRIRDHLGRDVAGAPADLPNDHATLRLQVEY